MLSPSAFDAIVTPITDLYEQYAQTVINDIARRLVKMGEVTASAAWQLNRLQQSGMVYRNALRELDRLTGISTKTLQAQFAQAGVKSMKFDDSLYKAVGLNPIPLQLSPAMLNVLLSSLRKTAGEIHNLTMTTALDAHRLFLDSADLAYMQVTTGAMSYTQAIRAAVKNVASKGLSMIDYASGHRDQLDVAMRRTVLTGVAQTTGDLTIARAGEMGTDLVQTSAHAGSRPTHEPWQGKVFSLSGSSDKYPPFVESTGYGEVDGLCGINCRHTFYPFFEGLSENAYSQSDVAELNNATVDYNGQTISQYDASQLQRKMERTERYWKRQAEALGAADLDNTAEMGMVKDYQAQLRDFMKQTGMLRQGEREGGRVLINRVKE